MSRSDESDSVFELTTVWTPECSTVFWGRSEDPQSCEPPHFEAIWTYDGYYSPGICFDGYTSGCDITRRDIGPSETAVNCVPSGFWATSVDEGSTTGIPALEIRWQEDDLTLLETHPLTPGLAVTSSSDAKTGSTADPGPSATEDPEPNGDGGGVSTSTAAGVALGAAAFVAVVCAAAFVWYRKRHKNLENAPAMASHDHDGTVVYGGSPETGASATGAPPCPVIAPTELTAAHYHTTDGAAELHGWDLVPELPPAQADHNTPVGLAETEPNTSTGPSAESNTATGPSPAFKVPRKPAAGETGAG